MWLSRVDSRPINHEAIRRLIEPHRGTEQGLIDRCFTRSLRRQVHFTRCPVYAGRESELQEECGKYVLFIEPGDTVESNRIAQLDRYLVFSRPNYEFVCG